MASHAAKTPLLRAVATRSYAAQAAAQQHAQPASSNVKVQTTVLPNKLVIASVENSSPISKVSVLFRAGSRNETPDNIGATHVLRVAAGLTTKGSTQFAITRNIQQIGGNLTAQGDRETIAYTLEANRDQIDQGLKYLGDVAARQVFKPWELTDNIARMKYELASRPAQTRVLNLLHRAAYRSGLGNSLYCPKYMVGKISTETLQHYVQCLFTTNRAAVCGVGVDHARLVAYAQELGLESGAGPASSAKYHGGEIRKQNATITGLSHVAVAVEGASLTNQKEALAFSVLQYALGTGPSVKWSDGSVTPLAAAVAGSVKEATFAVSALNVSYTDSGLFGFLLSCPGSVANVAVPVAVKVLRSGSVSSKDVARGKNMLTAALLMSAENSGDLLEEIGTQAVLLGGYTSAADLAAAVNSITDADVNAAAKKVAGGKLSLAAVGNLCCVPYVDQLS